MNQKEIIHSLGNLNAKLTAWKLINKHNNRIYLFNITEMLPRRSEKTFKTNRGATIFCYKMADNIS